MTAAWKVALDRTEGLIERRLRMDGADLRAMVANAYLMGITDLGCNVDLMRRAIEAAAPLESEGVGHA